MSTVALWELMCIGRMALWDLRHVTNVTLSEHASAVRVLLNCGSSGV